MSDTPEEVRTETPAEEVAVSTELRNVIEALVFASDEPMTVRFIRSIMEDVNKDLPPSEHYSVNADIIRKAVGELNRGYAKLGSGFRIIEIAGGFTYATQEQFSSWVGKLAKEKARRRLSPTAVETLAIIAYKQPITKGEVEFIRGVNVDYIINALLEKDLIHITGRANTPGRPLLYGTTQKFLEHFGLNDLTDLPKPREISELINETELEVDRRLLAEQQELEFREDLEKKLEGNEGSKNKPQRQPKVKVPDAVKEENRRAARPAEATDEKSAEATPTAEGAITSESTMTAGGATADMPVTVENVQEPVVPEAEGIAAPEVSGVLAETDSVPGTNEEPVLPADASGGMNVTAADEASSEQNARLLEDSTAESAPGVPGPELEPAVPISDSETSAALVPEETVPAISAGITAPAEMISAETSPDSGISETAPSPESGKETASGWSKWKNKVKTFFQKLFA